MHPARMGNGRGSSVLVVEDDEDALESTCIFLQSEGHRPQVARTVEEAKTALLRDAFDAVILDMNLHHESGRDVLEVLATRPHAPVVVVVSGTPEAVAIAASFGVLHVRKPYDVTDLASILATAHAVGARPSRP
jgi:two-component system, NtrC family, response regulator AlgB